MINYFKRVDQFLYEFFTLKRRIIFIFVLSVLIPLISMTLISYYTISSILTNKIQSSIQSNLDHVKASLENTITNLNHVSQQLTFQGSVGKELESYLVAEQPYDRLQLMNDMKTELSLISFTNPNVGLLMYYFEKDNTYLLENSLVKNDFSIEGLPLLAEYYKIAYFGPHISQDRFNNQYVLSALRKLDLPERDDIYVYIESGFKLMENIMDSDRDDKNSFYLILDNDGRIAYSEVPQVFPENTQFQDPLSKTASGLLKEYYWFKATSNQGWSLISLIQKNEYNKEKNNWIHQMLLLSFAFLLFALILAVCLWQMVYKPLNIFDKEIGWIAENNFNIQTTLTKILEFDYLLDQFQGMKRQIIELLETVKYNEQRRANLEIEKLLYQINPHFLMNTLNTVHWLAVMNEQEEIDQLAQSLNKLLSYGLGKMGENTTIQQEIEALKEYLTLQQFRYDFHYDIIIDVDEQTMNRVIPRFILQPLVENSIYHGLGEDAYIRVEVRLHEIIEISIHDNGAGISQEVIETLLNKQQVEQEKVGMGIGLNYVKRMLESYYEGKARLEIKSEFGKGTSVFVMIPIKE